ncbi:MAG: tetratricopeptide repeat protein [Pseudomonadota bacterium]
MNHSTIKVFLLMLILASALNSATLKASQTDALSLANQGVELYNRGNYAGTIERMNQALSVEPSLAEAAYYLGLSYMQQDQRAQAKTWFNHYLRLAPNGANSGEARQYLEYLNSLP